MGAIMGGGSHDLFEMSLSDDGVVVLRWRRGVAAGLAEARVAVAEMAALTSGAPTPLLVDARVMGPYDRDARGEFVRRGGLATAVAIVVESPLSRLMANFFLAVSRPEVPTRLFEDETDAVAWLRAYSR